VGWAEATLEGSTVVRLELLGVESEPEAAPDPGAPSLRSALDPALGLHPEFEALAAAIEAHLLHAAPIDHIPIRPVGTPFQLRVWEELRRIPIGQTRTYAQLGESLGEPKAVRAVATANAANRIAILIPCHRVIGSKGDLRGFHWGIQTKARLLDIETRFSSTQPTLFA
jgi:O-6-methylguanine DNA methyltransferase